MRFFIIFICIVGWSFTSCSGNETVEQSVVEKEAPRPLIVEEDGKYTEWYPGHQQIKKSGRLTPDGKRTGIWKYFSEQGVELSVSVYTNGELDGHIVVRHPNGLLNYIGEYENGKEVGEWSFYNEQGELIEVKNFDE